MSSSQSSIAILFLLVVAPAYPMSFQSSVGSSPAVNTSTSLTWEVGVGGDFGCVQAGCFTPLDPQIAYTTPIESILSNVYEPLFWYNGSSSTDVIPWLVKGYTVSGGGTIVNFTLRDGITFADGQPFNSSDVYFSLNRLLIEDGNTPYGNGNGLSWTLQQLLNTSLSTAFGGPQVHSSSWVDEVLAQNFVQTEGPLAFSMHILHPTASLPYLLAEPWAAIVDPSYVMAHDLDLWAASNSSYRQQNLLPYPALAGTLMNRIIEYFKDEAATCEAGSTPIGCAITYMDSSAEGSQAGTGPYTLQSVAINRSVVLQSRDDYWGGPYQFLGGRKISPAIQTVLIKNVPLQSDRTRDITRAASQGNATIIDLDTSLDSTRLFDVVNQTDWVDYNKLVPVIPNVTVDGPFTSFVTNAIAFVSNVTLPSTGDGTTYQRFQPFSDLRFRLAFADSVDLYALGKLFNGQGQVATSAIPPGLPPLGAYNSSDLPKYRYDPKMVQTLLLSAMASPITKFRFYNGTFAPAGLFNNTFGCTRLAVNDRCTAPVSQTITLTVMEGNTLNTAIMNQMASTINNVSQTYNMGLHVFVQTVATPSCYDNPGTCYMYPSGWVWDYPWVGDFDGGFYSSSPVGLLPADRWNLSSISRAWTQFESADSKGNVSGVIEANNRLNALANQMTLYLWTYYPYSFDVHTSNILGVSNNPSLYGQPFVTLSIGSESEGASGFLVGYGPIVAAALTISLAVVLGSLYVTRRRKASVAASKGGSIPAKVSPVVSTTSPGEGIAPTGLQKGEPKLEFERPETRMAFDYLVSSFIDDYMRKRMYSEQSGWRSLIQISEGCQISQGFLYGRGGRYGPVMGELMARGLVEARTFSGQRGRGGEVVRVRVAYDREPVKRFVDDTAMRR